jgi:hypothetical protein
MSKVTIPMLGTFSVPAWPLSQRDTVILGIALPVALPAAWAIYRQYSVSSRGKITSSRILPKGSSKSKDTVSATAAGAEAQRPVSMPADVPPADVSQFYERVEAHEVLATDLPADLLPGPSAPPSALLTAYIRLSMLAHTKTFAGKAIAKKLSADRLKTCQPQYIATLDFKKGDLVNGTYRVVYRGPTPGAEPETGSERIELALEIPDGWDGPRIAGYVVVAFQTLPPKVTDTKGGGKELLGQFSFSNEVWLWNGAPKGFFPFDYAFMRWFHSVTSGSLVLDSIDGLKRRAKNGTAL